MAVGARVPLLNAPAQYDQGSIQGLISAIEQRLQLLELTASIGWQMSNVTTTKTLDGSASDLDTTRNALATLINELIASGYLASSS